MNSRSLILILFWYHYDDDGGVDGADADDDNADES